MAKAKTAEVADKTEADEKTCFVISPIGDEGSVTRARADKMLHFIVRYVLEPRGYEIKRADTLSEPGMITNQIVQRIVECDLLVADLSEHNPNVFYELAIRHGLRKPYIQIIDSAYRIPFDTSGIRTIPVDLTDLYSVEKAREELAAQLDAVEEEGFVVESPISIAFDLEKLRSSGRADENILANLVEEVSRLRQEFGAKPKHSPNLEDKPKIHLIPGDWDELVEILQNNGFPNTTRQLLANFELKKYRPGIIELKKLVDFKEYAGFRVRFRNALKKLFGVSWMLEIEE